MMNCPTCGRPHRCTASPDVCSNEVVIIVNAIPACLEHASAAYGAALKPILEALDGLPERPITAAYDNEPAPDEFLEGAYEERFDPEGWPM